MKKPLAFLFAAVLFCGGCSTRYVITLNNGARIDVKGKPKKENGAYYFKDASGEPASIPAGSVREIAPASMAKEDKQPFKPQTMSH